MRISDPVAGPKTHPDDLQLLAPGSVAWHEQCKLTVTMLQTIAFILIILWLLGLVSSYTMGGFIHVLLVVALIVILVRVISGNKPVP